MTKTTLTLFACAYAICGATITVDRAKAVQKYVGDELAQKLAVLDKLAPGKRPVVDPSGGPNLTSLLPIDRSIAFVSYMRFRLSQPALASLAEQVAASQLNKTFSSGAGNTGVTSLLANGVAADVLSFATEYGAVTQTSSGNLATVNGNLAGLVGLFAGDPYLGCESLAVGGCSSTSRIFRGISSSLSVDTSANANGKTVTGTTPSGTPAAADIFASGSRMNSWKVRYDFQHKTLYDVLPAKFVQAMAGVSTSDQEVALDNSISKLMKDVTGVEGWRLAFLNALQNTPSGTLTDTLGQQLDDLITAMAAKDPDLAAKYQQAQNAIAATFLQRDAILESLQKNTFSVEFNGVHPLGQPNLSNVRLVYSHQPTSAPLLLTFNFAAEWYDSLPSGVNQSRLRDLQAAAQVDRQLGTIPKFGPVTLTAAFYYQWMNSNALIVIPAGNNAPGTGIVLPGTASVLLAPKGNIEIGQVKLTIPLKGGTLKVPVSFTWSNRTELINESEKKGQIGLTLDLDTLFGK